MFELAPGVSPQTADAIARRERLQRLALQPLALIGTTLYLYKIKDRRSVPTVIAVLERDGRIGAVQPNYVYTLQQGGQTGNFAKDQYAVPEMRLTEAHTISNGEKTLVAVIIPASIRPIPRLRVQSLRVATPLPRVAVPLAAATRQ